ncbi:MAG: SGNH/GDSL hydrolase family protein [Armatimonadetes bacterium]|nr:SGNH/GDSL hydrolase family protein [Armatimonadota bacterium]
MRRLPLASDTPYYVSLGDAQSRNTGSITGAASAFYAHLTELVPATKMIPLASDGANAGAVRYVQLPRLRAMAVAPSVVTITTGATDLPRLASGDADAVCGELAEHGGAALSALRSLAPRAAVLLSTLYDPMDGASDVLAGGVRRFNETLRALAASHGYRVADAFTAFAGHGASAGDPLSPDATPEDTNRFLCAGADLVPVPNAHGAAFFAGTLWTTYNEEQ